VQSAPMAPRAPVVRTMPAPQVRFAERPFGQAPHAASGGTRGGGAGHGQGGGRHRS